MNQYPPLKYLSLLFLVITTGYLFTLNPALFRNDSPETIVGCMTLGVTHPPGYPLFNLLGHLFYIPIGNPAFSFNFLATLLGAFGCCLLYINVWILIQNTIFEEASSASFAQNIASFVAASCLAFSQGYWGNAIAAKGGIYIFQVVIELGLFLTWQLSTKTDSRKFGLLTLFLFSISLTNHWPTALLLTPAFCVLFVLTDNKKHLLEPTKLLLASSLGIIGLSLYLYLPLRAIHYPPIDFDIPITFKSFITSISRAEYTLVEFIGNDPERLSTTIGPKAAYISGHFFNEFQVSAYLLVLIGVTWLWKKNTKTPLFLGLVFLATSISNLFYLKVEPIEYWHMDDHLLSSNWIFALFIGGGVFQLLKITLSFPKLYRGLAVTFVLLIGPLTYFNHLKANDQKNAFLYYGYGESTLKAMPLGTLFFAESDYDYFSLLYLKTALDKRPDTQLVLMPFLSKPGEVNALKVSSPTISKDLSPMIFRDLVIQNQGIHPIMTMFPNGSFSKEYLHYFGHLSIKPLGLAVLVSNPEPYSKASPSYGLLTDFWAHYADSREQKGHIEEGLLRQTCAIPYSNEAYFQNLSPRSKPIEKNIQTLEKIRSTYLIAGYFYKSAGNESEANKTWNAACLLYDSN